ncbi:MAG: hypothetical protein H7Y16_04980 [Candidatus Parcubacteria bacterium]|nr:hypothetical protein [Burkholderiales bacterium]
MRLSRFATVALLACVAAAPAMSFSVSFVATAAPQATAAPDSSVYAGPNTKEPKSLPFIVYRVERRPAGEFVVTFESGETWQQVEPDVTIELTRGETVVIRRRGGSFVLESRTGLSTRVKRVRY